jgi:HAE1 family hydrophobic/amphiphilic exporter-1
MGFFAGQGGANQSNISITLKPKDEGRKDTATQVIARLRPELAQLVGVQVFLQANQDINVGGRAGQAQYQYTLSDSDLAELNTWAPKLLSALQQLPQLKDVSSDQQSKAGAVNLTIDRDAAARFGITPADIDTAVYNLVGQREVTQYFTQLNAYHVVLEAPPGHAQVVRQGVHPIAGDRQDGAALLVRQGRCGWGEQPDG